MKKIFTICSICLFGMLLKTQAANNSYVPKNSDRIIFVGDSITGLGELRKGGWGRLIREALETKGEKSNVIMLGGSGHQVQSWQGIEKRSRTQETLLDSKKFDVKKELDEGAPVLVIMLGMNDVLAPYVNMSEKALDSWEARYKVLIKSLQERVKAKRICLATVTMCTEDLESYKNKLIDLLNKRIEKIARENGFAVVHTSKRYKEAFVSGRSFKNDYHIMYDYVHPEPDGHKAIALAMLEGLGKKDEAEYIKKKYFDKIGVEESKGQIGISYTLEPQSLVNTQKNTFKINYNVFNTEDKMTVTITTPKGWASNKNSIKGNSGTFVVKGDPNRLRNRVTLTATKGNNSYEKHVNITAPWLITWGINQPRWFSGTHPFNIEASTTNIDNAIANGSDFLSIAPNDKAAKQEWQLYYPNCNYTGGKNPGSIDFASVSSCRPFEAGFGVQWIHSSKARELSLNVSSKIFAGAIYLTVWVNNNTVYQDELTKKKRKKDQATIAFQKGWNKVVFKSNRCTWQWQQAIEFSPVEGDSLDDLRYSTVKK